MLPPVFALVSTDAGCTAKLGAGDACRCYPFGDAPVDVTRPYVTFFTVAGSAENTQADAPPSDRFVGQIDAWADSPAAAVSTAQAVRSAVERYGQVTAYNPSDRDPETGRYRYSFDAEFVVKR